MNISIQIRLNASVLQNVITNGIFPDSLENLLYMRIQDLFRTHKIKYEKINKEVVRSHGLLFNLYQITMLVRDINYDKNKLAAYIAECLSPYKDSIKKVDMLIHKE